MSKAENSEYTVTTNMAIGDNRHTIAAAYYQHEYRFTVFKGTQGDILASFANDHIVGIQRTRRSSP